MKQNLLRKIMNYSSLGIIACGFALLNPANGTEIMQQDADEFSKATWSDSALEAWRQGKLETIFLLNKNLKSMSINTSIDGHIAVLSGYVQSKVQKELAEQLALSVDGITDVRNDLFIEQDFQKQQTIQNEFSHFLKAVNDAGISTSIKTRFIASDLKSREIDIDTENGSVVLNGSVESAAHADLAQTIAKNTEGVIEVKNNLNIMGNVARR